MDSPHVTASSIMSKYVSVPLSQQHDNIDLREEEASDNYNLPGEIVEEDPPTKTPLELILMWIRMVENTILHLGFYWRLQNIAYVGSQV